MNPSAIYRKSAQGTEAVATRQHGPLTPRLRSLLIMIDGKRTPAELAQLTMQADVEPPIDQLIELGLIEESAPAAPPPQPAANAAPAAIAPSRTVPLAEAQRFAARRLTDLLGPTAEDLCLKIESTRNAADFMKIMQRVEALLRELRGAGTAAEFARDMESHRPA